MIRHLILSVSAATLVMACSNSTEPTEPDTHVESDAHANESHEEHAAHSDDMASADLCLDAGPQTPRDISKTGGLNTVSFPVAPPAAEMNLCNIHTHTNAEHKGPGFSVFVDDTDHGGYACNDGSSLSEAELTAAPGAFGGVKPGDTIEVHWVHTSCQAEPGEGLGACVPETCTDPVLRVEAQAFLIVNDADALDFMEFATTVENESGGYNANALPEGTGTPVQFLGSTTGPSYTQATCSPAQVTWNVRPQCAKLDINSLHAWAESGNAFNEVKSHGVRQLVTAPELLSPIE